VVDDIIPQSPNLVAGANEAGYHLLNVNYGRDYQADSSPISLRPRRARPPDWEATMLVRGVEVKYLQAGDALQRRLRLHLPDRRDSQAGDHGLYGIGSPAC
jgi:prolyl-tRNA synthetase